MKKNTRSIDYRFIDTYGKKLFVSKDRNAKINFTLCHEEIIENSERHEFRNITLNISKNTNNIYNLFDGIYNCFQNKVIISENPIRDGRNFMILEKDGDDYYIFIRHDLANELRNPLETKIELSGKYINDIYNENLEKPKTLIKRLQH